MAMTTKRSATEYVLSQHSENLKIFRYIVVLKIIDKTWAMPGFPLVLLMLDSSNGKVNHYPTSTVYRISIIISFNFDKFLQAKKLTNKTHWNDRRHAIHSCKLWFTVALDYICFEIESLQTTETKRWKTTDVKWWKTIKLVIFGWLKG